MTKLEKQSPAAGSVESLSAAEQAQAAEQVQQIATEARELRAQFRGRLAEMWNVSPDERQARSR